METDIKKTKQGILRLDEMTLRHQHSALFWKLMHRKNARKNQSCKKKGSLPSIQAFISDFYAMLDAFGTLILQ